MDNSKCVLCNKPRQQFWAFCRKHVEEYARAGCYGGDEARFQEMNKAGRVINNNG